MGKLIRGFSLWRTASDRIIRGVLIQRVGKVSNGIGRGGRVLVVIEVEQVEHGVRVGSQGKVKQSLAVAIVHANVSLGV